MVDVTKAEEMLPTDRELDEIIEEKTRTSIKVVGAGGAGNNTINRLLEVGVEGATCISVNTDAQQLRYNKADDKILIGKEITGGLGAGSFPEIGRKAAEESKHLIKSKLKGSDLVFLTCGLGGGTGTGGLPVIAEVAKSLNSLTIAIVTLPFSVEGKKRMDNASRGLEELKKYADTIIVIPNDKLLEIVPDLPLATAFKVCDEILVNAVKGIAELVTRPGLINLDFADVKTVMQNGGMAMIGVGESDSEKRAKESVDKAINNPLLDVDIRGAKGAMINVTGGTDLTLEESKQIVEAVSGKLDPGATVIWGSIIDESLRDIVRVMLIVTGVKSTQIISPPLERKERKEKAREELGIDIISG